MIEAIATVAVMACLIVGVARLNERLIQRRQDQFRQAVERKDWAEVDRVLGIAGEKPERE